MKPKLIIIFLLIVLLPLALLVWLGLRVANYEQKETQRQFEQLLQNRLSDIDQNIINFLEQRQRELQQLTKTSNYDIASLRNIVRDNPIITQMFYLDQEGNLQYPTQTNTLNKAETTFLERAREIFASNKLMEQSIVNDNDNPTLSDSSSYMVAKKRAPQKPQTRFFYAESQKDETENTEESYSLGFSNQMPNRQKMATLDQSQGWYVWYWSTALHLMYWQKLPSGQIIGAELDNVRLASDIIGILPATQSSAKSTIEGCIRLTNPLGDSLYQWGPHNPEIYEQPLTSKTLSYPLNLWQLDYYFPIAQLLGTQKSLAFNIIAALAVLTIALISLAIFFYRESCRDIRQASQRVSFVNQVSHELKTPLTNIRMYAELMEGTLSDEDEKSKKHLNIVVSESQRLSRLIGNILNFSRKERNKLTIHRSNGTIDDVIKVVMDHFKPSFDTHDIEIHADLNATQLVSFDHDALEQILGNLFNNVEKYAKQGKVMHISSRQDHESTTMKIWDHGPGIPSRKAEKIFAPFFRISDKIQEGASGTGIGLTIAQELARMHSGDLKLLESKTGALFQVTLKTPIAKEKQL